MIHDDLGCDEFPRILLGFDRGVAIPTVPEILFKEKYSLRGYTEYSASDRQSQGWLEADIRRKGWMY